MKYCCEDLKRYSETPVNHNRYQCPDALIDRWKNGTTGIIIHDGGTSMAIINYCPWCGSALEQEKTIKQPHE
jgi:hypothetical protein